MEKTMQERVNDRFEAYRKDYDIDNLNSSNDLALLRTLIQSEIVLEDLQARLFELLRDGDLIESASEIKKLSDLTRDIVLQNMKIQETLGIDRRSRKTSEESPIDYIRKLKVAANNFISKRMTRIYCQKCNVMVARFAPVHAHTGYELKVQCSQCKEYITQRREPKDPLFDIPDRSWRTERAEIILPEETNIPDIQLEEDYEVDYASGEFN